MTGIEIMFMLTTIQLGLPDGLLSSVCYIETRHTESAMHLKDGVGTSIGICQLKLKTARQVGFRGTEKELLNPINNIYYAGKYLRHQITRYHGSIKKGVIAYNYGHARGLTSTKYQRKVYQHWRRRNYEF